MNRILNHRRSMLTWVLVLALALRSLIPAGFMPDFSNATHGGFALTICDGVHHHPAQDGTKHSDVCPFSVGAVYGFDGVATPILSVSDVFSAIEPSPALQPSFDTAATFSNASPRSPPAFS